MEKYLKRLCNAILADRFNEEKYRARQTWNGVEIQTMPLFCSYGKIGFTITVYAKTQYEIQYDWEMKELTIDEEDWKDYINELYLEDFGITSNGNGELECYTDAGEDMIITLDKVRKKNLQEYIDGFDINAEVLLWWQNGIEYAREKKVPFDNIKEHYEDYEAYLKNLQKVCNKMPF
jgi:hypothetical protein